MRCKCNKDLHNIFEACLVQVVFSEGLKTVSTTHVAEGIFIWKLVASLVAAQGEMEKLFFLQSKLYFQWLLLRQKGVLVCWVHGCSDSCSWSKAIFGFNHMLLDMYGFCMFSIVALILVQQELEWFNWPNFLDWFFSVNLMALKSSYWKGWAHRAD